MLRNAQPCKGVQINSFKIFVINSKVAHDHLVTNNKVSHTLFIAVTRMNIVYQE